MRAAHLAATLVALVAASRRRSKHDGARPAGDDRPVGIVNTGNFCYMAALLQTLYWLPDVRRWATTGRRDPPSDSERFEGPLHLALGAFFTRMATTSAHSVSPKHDLMPVLRSVLADRGAVELGACDDADAFWRFVAASEMPAMGAEFFALRRERDLVVTLADGADAPQVVFGRREVTEVGGANAKVAAAPGRPVDALLTAADTTNTTPYTFRPAEHIDNRAYAVLDSAGRAVDTAGRALSEVMAALGVRGDVSVTVSERMRLLAPLPPVVVVAASKFTYDAQRGRQRWDASLQTVFARDIALCGHAPGELLGPDAARDDEATSPGRSEACAEQEYGLHAIVAHVPTRTHYVAAVCTDTATAEWHLFDDERVTALDGPPVPAPKRKGLAMTSKGHRVMRHDTVEPYLFFYVRSDVRARWAKTKSAPNTHDPVQRTDVRHTVDETDSAHDAPLALAHTFRALRDIRGAVDTVLALPSVLSDRSSPQRAETRHAGRLERDLLKKDTRHRSKKHSRKHSRRHSRYSSSSSSSS